MLTPLRDASSHLPMFFDHLRNLTYPHNLIDLAFLVSDSRDDTLGMLSRMLQEVGCLLVGVMIGVCVCGI